MSVTESYKCRQQMKGTRDHVYSDFSFPSCFSVRGSKEQCLICGGRLCFLLAPCILAPAWLNQLTVMPCKTQRMNTRKSEKMPRNVSRFKFPLNSITYVSGKTLNSAGRLLSCFLEFTFHQNRCLFHAILNLAKQGTLVFPQSLY